MLERYSRYNLNEKDKQMIIFMTALSIFAYNRYINAATAYKYEQLLAEITHYEQQGLCVTEQERNKWIGG